jgi:hypothetical protein
MSLAAPAASSSRKAGAVDKLSDYDDICTDLLVDKVEFWSEIHKMSKNYKAKRRVTDREILTIIRRLVRGETAISEAAQAVLRYRKLYNFLIQSLDGLKLWTSGMNEEDQTDFSKYD